jgi:hypothetical protein
MVFGMWYLLLPPYLGQTLPDHRPAGAHFAVAVVGLSLLVAASAWMRRRWSLAGALVYWYLLARRLLSL